MDVSLVGRWAMGRCSCCSNCWINFRIAAWDLDCSSRIVSTRLRTCHYVVCQLSQLFFLPHCIANGLLSATYYTVPTIRYSNSFRSSFPRTRFVSADIFNFFCVILCDFDLVCSGKDSFRSCYQSCRR